MTDWEVGLTVAQVGSVPAIIWAAARLVSAASGLVSATGHAIAEVMMARRDVALPKGPLSSSGEGAEG